MVSNNPWNQQKFSLGPAYLINAPIYEAPCSHTLLQICGSHPKLEISALESSPVSTELLFSESLQRFLWWPSYCSVSPVNFLFGITECKTTSFPPPFFLWHVDIFPHGFWGKLREFYLCTEFYLCHILWLFCPSCKANPPRWALDGTLGAFQLSD